jgi:hypothetical protein
MEFNDRYTGSKVKTGFLFEISRRGNVDGRHLNPDYLSQAAVDRLIDAERSRARLPYTYAKMAEKVRHSASAIKAEDTRKYPLTHLEVIAEKAVGASVSLTLIEGIKPNDEKVVQIFNGEEHFPEYFSPVND